MKSKQSQSSRRRLQPSLATTATSRSSRRVQADSSRVDSRPAAAVFVQPDEAARIEALQQYRILDTPAEAAFDDLTALAALVCETSIAALNFVDKDRQWFKSHVGLGISEIPRSVGLCPHALLAPDLLVVRDVLRDPRCKGGPLSIGTARLRFYAGAPLRTLNGHVLGTIFVADTVPRTLNQQQQQALRTVSRQVMAQLELRRRITEQQRADEALRESEELFRSLSASSPVGIFLTDTEGRCIYSNPRCRDILGFSLMESLGTGWTRAVHPADRNAVLQEWFECTREGREYSREIRTLNDQNEVRWIHVRASKMLSDSGELKGHVVTVEEVTERKHTETTLRELSGHLMRLQDSERRHIARELHDATGQKLAALSINLSKLPTAALSSEAQTILAETTMLADQCSREIRTLSYLLHPPMFDELGLTSALQWLVEGFSQRSGITVNVEVSPAFRRLPPDTEMALFRIVQESLTNIHRHSGSSTARIRIVQRPDGVALEVLDEGRGLVFAEHRTAPVGGFVPGVGLAGMRERVKQLGGTIEVQGAEGKGTSVRVWLPASEQSHGEKRG